MISLGEGLVTRSLAAAGIEVNGRCAWDIQIENPNLYSRLIRGGSLGLGESYMDEWWECADLEEFLYRLIRHRNSQSKTSILVCVPLLLDLRRWLFNLQTQVRARDVVDTHYDLPAHLFEDMLGQTMAYSCAYWQEAHSLDQGQRNKLDLICRKLELKPSDRVLDLGCGFGSFSKFAAENYGCSVVAVTLSGSQAEFAREFCRGLPVEVHQCDYREVDQYAKGKTFDKIASIAMFEAVGRRHFRSYMQIIHRLLSDKGLWLLHTIGNDRWSSDPWLEKHIFPNGELPTIGQISASILDLFSLEDLHNFGLDYRRTLAAWETNFRDNWDAIRGRDEAFFNARFFRKWIYYLNCCKAAFRARNMQLWQIVMSKGYDSISYQSVR